ISGHARDASSAKGAPSVRSTSSTGNFVSPPALTLRANSRPNGNLRNEVGKARDISATNRMQLADDHGVRAPRAPQHVTEPALAASTKTARTSPPDQIHPRDTSLTVGLLCKIRSARPGQLQQSRSRQFPAAAY